MCSVCDFSHTCDTNILVNISNIININCWNELILEKDYFIIEENV